MKLIIKEYLSSLKERNELDKAVLPNILSEIGLRVLNLPMIGTRQHGVDIAAVGKIRGEDDTRYLYLFCIKAGDISRTDWDSGPQSVRQELNEIRDNYLRSCVSQEFKDLPVKICVCCGGDLNENILQNWAGYTSSNQADNLLYELWNGDRLAEYMMQCLLARELLGEQVQRNFQKAVAMVNEPDVCYEYTSVFLRGLLLEKSASKKIQLLKLRQSCICTHAVIAWARESGNLDSAYRVSELGMLLCWHQIRSTLENKSRTKHEEQLVAIFSQFLQLYIISAEWYLDKLVYKHSNRKHALSMAVRSRESTDIKLSLFDLLGRLALFGIWQLHTLDSLSNLTTNQKKKISRKINSVVKNLVAVINNNPILNSPIKDDHMIEIALVMFLAQRTGTTRQFLPWIDYIAMSVNFTLRTNSQYPTCMQEYADLLAHPASEDSSYREMAAAGSVLYPFIFYWMAHSSETDSMDKLAKTLADEIPSCTHQAWIPDELTDTEIWAGGIRNGVGIPNLLHNYDHKEMIEMLKTAMEDGFDIEGMSAMRFNMYPLFLTACRHYRLPIPPNVW